MAILSSTRRHSSLLLVLHRHLFTPTSPSLPPQLSVASAKSRLLKEFDPDKSLSILSSVSSSDSSTNPASNRFAVDITVRRLARSRRFSDIESLLESRKSSSPYASQEPFLATLILTYGSARMLDHALRTFHAIPSPTVVSFNAVLSAAIKSKQHLRVPVLFSELSKKYSITPDQHSYGILIKSLCLSGEADEAFETLKEMEEKKLEPTTVIYTTLLDCCYKKGNPEEAKELWKEMASKGCMPDLAAYNVRVMYKGLNGKPEEVLELISELEVAGLKPDAITYNYLITCYCKNGQFNEAKEVYKGLKDKGCNPNAATFKNLLQFLCGNGDFDAGLEVCMDSMKHNKIPDFRTMRDLVVGLVKGSKVEEAKKVIDVVKKRFPENLLGGWKKVEKDLSLNVDGEVADRVESA